MFSLVIFFPLLRTGICPRVHVTTVHSIVLFNGDHPLIMCPQTSILYLLYSVIVFYITLSLLQCIDAHFVCNKILCPSSFLLFLKILPNGPLAPLP
jgi:hypothetical protein